MGRINKNEICWFEKEDHRKDLTATLYKNGRLYLGKSLFDLLPDQISLGFHPKKRTLVITGKIGSNPSQRTSKIAEYRGLPAEITKLGLCLPVRFLFARDEETGYWLGRIVLKSKSDMEQVLVLYQHVIDSLIYQYAKTTPIEERKAIALAELYTAVTEYQPWHGSMESYLEERIRERLLSENKHYTAIVGNEYASLDAPFSAEDTNGFCRYDLLADDDAGGILDIEAQMMLEQFAQSLSKQEHQLFRLAQSGCTMGEISSRMGLDEQAVLSLANEVGQKRRHFYQAA